MTLLRARRALVAVALAVASGVGTGVVTAPAVHAQSIQETTVAAVKDGRAVGKIKVYNSASLTAPSITLQNSKQIKGRVVFTVLENRGEWLRVSVPARPNGRVGYIRAAEVTTFTHPYSMVVELGAKKLHVFRAGELIMSITVGVGTTKTPTPLGRFYTVDLIKDKRGPRGPYGSFAYGISGYSAVYQTFGSGDGRVGIHGTPDLNSLGKNSTNGCIRMSNTDITRLSAMLPLGVPVEIRN